MLGQAMRRGVEALPTLDPDRVVEDFRVDAHR
jgi:hypothetical protein